MSYRAVHFVGIGGVSMSALAEIALHHGLMVSGSDIRESALTRRLEAMGARVFAEHRAEHVAAAAPDLVVFTDAARADNPEVAEARRRGIPVRRRADYLGDLMDTYAGPRICVAGTHGKTTTTAMLAEALLSAGLDPTVLVGGDYAPFCGTLRLGRTGVFVTEACEAFRSFHSLRPDVAIVTNIEPDHLDCYHDEAGVVQGFQTFVAGVRSGGALVIRAEGAAEQAVAARAAEAGLRVVRFGMDENASTEVWASDLRHGEGRSHYTPVMRGSAAPLDPVTLQVPGEHNVLNSLAVLAAATLSGASPAAAVEGLAQFRGVGRRFEVLGEREGVTVVDDYSHHPTEIRATIAAARGTYPGRPIVAVFQPHLFSRTRDFLDDFGRALAGADALILTGIYAAREEPIEGVTPTALAARVAAAAPGMPLHVELSKARVPALISRLARAGDVVLILGAGDIREAGERYVAGYEEDGP